MLQTILGVFSVLVVCLEVLSDVWILILHSLSVSVMQPEFSRWAQQIPVDLQMKFAIGFIL